MERKIYDKLLDWKKSGMDKALMVVGARQVGKTYIIKEFCKNEFNDYVYINLLKDEWFTNYINMQEDLETRISYIESHLNRKISNTILVVDEVQLCEKFISDIKLFMESSTKYNIIIVGSLLGVKLLKLNVSFPVGKIKRIYMYPLDFEEFLLATNNKSLRDLVKTHYENMQELPTSMHNKLLELYKDYLYVGGMPDSINNYVSNNYDMTKYDSSIISDIINDYKDDMSHYVKNNSDTIKIQSIYDSISSQLGNKSHKFQYSKVENNAKSREYSHPLDWLFASKMVYKSINIKKINSQIEIIEDEDFKLYLGDVGILINKLGLNYSIIKNQENLDTKGVIAENYVAEQLTILYSLSYNVHNNLNYWKSGNEAEIDFIIKDNNGYYIPVEVKSAENTQSKSLKTYIDLYNPKYSIRISTKNFGNTNNIKSIPLYAVWCIEV